MKNISISLILLILITCVVNCNESKAEGYMENNNFDSPEELWNQYLSALKTGEEENIKAVSLTGYNFTKTWLDENNYKKMCVDLGDGWSKSSLSINTIDDLTAVGYLKVDMDTQAYFFFGPTILIHFKRVNDKWEIEHIDFEGD